MIVVSKFINLVIRCNYMEKKISKSEKIKKSLAEMESHLSDSELEDSSKEKISQMAEKGRVFIDRAENKAHEIASKIKEEKGCHCHGCSDDKKEKMKKCFISAFVAFLAIVTFKKMKKKFKKDEE